VVVFLQTQKSRIEKSSQKANSKTKLKGSSNEDIPSYNNGSLNGKGFTLNGAPEKR